MTHIIVVTGSHALTASERIWTERMMGYTLQMRSTEHWPHLWLYHGDAHGVDRTAEKVAKELNFERIVAFPAQWERYKGKRAGMVRNAKMVEAAYSEIVLHRASVECIAFFPKGHETPGTLNTIELASKRGIPVVKIVNETARERCLTCGLPRTRYGCEGGC